MNKKKKLLSAALLLSLIPCTANAELWRTVYSWDTKTADAGNFQVGVWGFYYDYDYSNGATYEEWNPNLYLDYGITDRWEVGISTGYSDYSYKNSNYPAYNQDENGIGDTSVYTSYRYLDEAESGLDLAFRGAIRLPTGDEDKDLGTGSFEPSVSVIASKTLGPVIAVGEIGVKYISDPRDDEKDAQASYILEGVFPVTDQFSLSLFADGYTTRWDDSSYDSYHSVGAGMMFKPSENTAISFHASKNISTSNDIYYYGVGFDVEF